MEHYKNRKLEANACVAVYRNLNNQKFSLQSTEGEFKGLVVAHTNNLLTSINDPSPSFKISLAGQQRVRKTERKNVHCFILGKVSTEMEPDDVCNWIELTYDPYRDSGFVYKSTLENWDGLGQYVYFTNSRCFLKR